VYLESQNKLQFGMERVANILICSKLYFGTSRQQYLQANAQKAKKNSMMIHNRTTKPRVHCILLPLWSDTVLFKIHYSYRFREVVVMPSYVDVCLLKLFNFCHQVRNMVRQHYLIQ
jgi:hypothetical protein